MMVEERDGWFVLNVKDAPWFDSSAFGRVCSFEDQKNPFPEVGLRIFLLEPGKPNCRYHREEAQEDFLVLAGECTLLVNGEQRPLRTWDFVHCPAGVSHVFVGAGSGPCALMAVGKRPSIDHLHYPKSEMSRKYNAETPEATADPAVAYSDVPRREPCDTPDWPIGS